MADSEQTDISWHKSTASGGGDCVEIAFADDESVRVRNSRDPLGSMLSFSRQAWLDFLEGASNGEFIPDPADNDTF